MEVQHPFQGVQMPWHKPDWVHGFGSLIFLVEFHLRTWYHLEDTNKDEIKIIKEWINFGPPQLKYVVVSSGARQKPGRQFIWNSGELCIRELVEDYDIAFS